LLYHVRVHTWEDREVHVGVHRGVRRVPLREAAQLLGVSKDAVRQRIRRGTIRSDKGEDGRVYVYVDAFPDAVHDRQSEAGFADPRDQLIEQLRGEVEAWREESRRKDTIIMNMTEAMKALSPPEPRLAQEEEPRPQEEPYAGTREYAVSEAEPTPQPGRVGPQTPLEGAQEPAGSPTAATGEPGRGEPRSSTGGRQTGSERVSWWARIFGR
jgi:hypothetical protein